MKKNSYSTEVKRNYLIFTSIIIIMSILPFLNLFGQNYDDLWNKVKELQDKDLPRKVIDGAQEIYDKASKEKNFPQLAKSWITIVETKCDLDPDSFRIANLPPLPHNGAVQDAVYNALMGSAYTAMKDSHISDFDEETKEEYTLKSHEHFSLALVDKKSLAEASALDYLPLIDEGKDSQLYRHDMLSLLTRFVLEQAQWDDEAEAQLLASVCEYYKQAGQRDAYALSRLQYLKKLNDHSDYNRRLPYKEYRDSLKALVDETLDIDAGADVAMTYCETIYPEDEKLAFARWAQNQYKGAYCINYFRNVEKEIMHSNCLLKVPNNILPGKPFEISIDYENLTEISLEVRLFNGRDRKYKLKTDGKLIDSHKYTLGDDSTNVARRAQNLPTEGEYKDQLSLPAGHYVLITRTSDKVTVDELEITSLKLFLFEMPSDEILAIVYNIESGRPAPNATVYGEGRSDDDIKKFRCNDKGEAIISSNEKLHNYWARIEGTDDMTQQRTLYNNYYVPYEKDIQCNLFTDRSIYRPGHTVHVSAIVFYQQHDDTEVVAGKHYTLFLLDPNGREAGKAEVVTNEYGSYDCDFVIPTDRLPGYYTVRDNARNSVSFRVEEYKRPTFDITTKAADAGGREIQIGDTINVEVLAKTYSDVPVQGAKVKYRISTAKAGFWYWYDRDWEELSAAEGETDDEGRFTVPLFLDPMKLADNDDNQLLRYRVSFDVTDMAGETHSSSFTTSVSRLPFSLRVSHPSPYDLSSDNQVIIEANNANRETVKVSGSYTLFLSQDNTEIAHGTFVSGEPIQLPKVVPGQYHILAESTANDEKKTAIRCTERLIIFDSEAAISLPKTSRNEAQKDVTRFDDNFFHIVQQEFSSDRAAEVLFSPSEQDVLVSYMLLANERMVKRSSFVLGRDLYRLTIPYDRSYGDGLQFLIWYARNGKTFFKSINLSYVRPDKSLQLSWSTFRDRLYPGQAEEWTLTIRDNKGKPVNGAELLATMYDASLDAFSSHSLPFGISFPRHIRTFEYEITRSNYGTSLSACPSFSPSPYRSRDYDELTEFIHQRWLYPSRSIRIRGLGASRANSSMSDESEEEVLYDMAAEVDEVPRMMSSKAIESSAQNAASEEGETETEAPAVSLRSNFAETAFFYPHLHSDAKGNVRITFTLPESLTQWKFLGLAHDKKVNYGRILATAVARKDFMVQPNMPRFVREGDKTRLVARIINQGETNLKGTARIRLLDAETEKQVFTSSCPFSVAQGKTTSVSFDVEIDDRYPMLICEMSGVSGNFSDGERNFLPVLTSKKYITEAIPFYVTRDDKVKDIDVSSLFNEGSPTATKKRLLFEYTARPEWTVIEALDGIKLPATDCSVAYGASLYANTMASRIAQGIPGFAEAVREAKKAGIKATSQLDENEELRDIVLKESPWVNDALREADQRERLIDLFDENLMKARINKAKEKLQLLQLSDGSWSWFEGMKGSYYITLSICEDLAMLQSDDAEIQKMLERGLSYLDAEELDRYEYNIKHKYPIHASNSTLQYLYISALVPDHEVSTKVSTMREAYLKDIESNVKDLTIQGRAVAACVLRTFGHTSSADDFLESAVEYTVSKPGMGRFYATDQAYYSWRDYRIPTQLAAMRAIRQSSRADKQNLLNEMQIWLLRQKQTQTWDNEMNTIAAIDFLLGNSQANGETITANVKGTGRIFSLNAKPIPAPLDTSRFLAKQLGYVRTNVDDKYTAQPLQKFTITADGNSSTQPVISWGALYAQYLEEMDQLKNQTTGELKVAIKFLKDGKDFDPNTQTLNVGDKVTMRVIITADRDMDFVQIRAQRPACFEPVTQYSGYRWMNGRGGYVSMHDASTDIFFDMFTKGTTTYDIQFHVDRAGTYLSGVTTAQCAYAPEYVAHTQAYRITVK